MGHFSRTKGDGREEKFQRDPRDVKDRRCDAGLDLLDGYISETSALDFVGECVDLAEVFDDPALAQLAVDGLLRSAKVAGAEKAVGYDEAASGAEESVGFADEAGFVCAGAVATAFDGVDGVEGFGCEAVSS